MNFYDRYSQLCIERGIEPCSQSAADMFGVSKSTISSWNTKGTIPKGDNVAAVADALGVSTDYLLGRTDNPVDYSNSDVIASLVRPVVDEFYRLYLSLDEIDRAKAEAYVSGLLEADKYTIQDESRNA